MPRLLVRTGLVVALAAAPLWARAEPPSGSYAIDLPAEPGIVLPTDLDEDDCETVEGVTICASGQLTTDGAGAIDGDATLAFSGEIEGELAGYFDGKVAGQAGDPRVTLSMLLEGELTSQGMPLEILASSRARCARNALAGGFDCSGSMKLCAYYLGARIGCESERIAYFVEDDTGSWQLRLIGLTTAPDGSVSGTAEVELSNGQVFSYAVTGKYSSRTDSSSLRLAELGTARGSKLRLASVVLTGGAATAGSLDYQIAGQKGRATLPVATTATAAFYGLAPIPEPRPFDAPLDYGVPSFF